MAKFKITWQEMQDEDSFNRRLEEIKAEIKFDATAAIRRIIDETKNNPRFNAAKSKKPDEIPKAIKSLIAVKTMEAVANDKPKIDELNKALGISNPNSNIQINYSEIAVKIYEANKTEFT